MNISFILMSPERNGGQRFEKYYLIFDAATHPEEIEAAVEEGTAFKADTIAELANAAGLDAVVLEETVQRYNELCAAGSDEDYNKEAQWLIAFETAPYYLVPAFPIALGTFGGLSIDTQAQMISTEGTPITNLYAAKEVANTDYFGEVYPVSGSYITFSIVSGRIAGVQAAANAKD